MASSLSESNEFFFENSSSSYDSNIYDMLRDDDIEYLAIVLAIKEIEDRWSLLNRQHRSLLGRICVLRNQSLGHH
jgi:hypothetical protein